MENRIYNEKNGLWYEKHGDYYLPCLALPEQENVEIGIWGQRYRRHLKTQHKVIYYNYLTKGTLYQHLAEVDKRAENMLNQLVKSLAEKENVTEELKANDMMLWVQKMNNIRNRATEIVNDELIFS